MAAFNVLAASVNAFLSFSIFSDQQDEAATIMKEILEEMDADKDKPGYFPCENFTEAMLFIWLQLIASFVTDAVLESLWKMLKDEQFCLQQIPSLQKMKELLKAFWEKITNLADSCSSKREERRKKLNIFIALCDLLEKFDVATSRSIMQSTQK